MAEKDHSKLYAILTSKKIKSHQDLRRILQHVLRDKNAEMPENVDKKFTKDNIYYINNDIEKALEACKKNIEDGLNKSKEVYKQSQKEKQILGFDIVLSASEGFWHKQDGSIKGDKEISEWAQQNLEYLQKRFDVQVFAIHRDETSYRNLVENGYGTVHAHATCTAKVVDISNEKLKKINNAKKKRYDKNVEKKTAEYAAKGKVYTPPVYRELTKEDICGTLSYRNILGMDKYVLSNLQSDYHINCAKNMGLERGEKNAGAKREDQKEFFKLANKELDEKNPESIKAKAKMADFKDKQISGLEKSVQRSTERIKDQKAEIAELRAGQKEAEKERNIALDFAAFTEKFMAKKFGDDVAMEASREFYKEQQQTQAQENCNRDLVEADYDDGPELGDSFAQDSSGEE